MNHSIMVNGKRVMGNGYGVWRRKQKRKTFNGKVCCLVVRLWRTGRVCGRAGVARWVHTGQKQFCLILWIGWSYMNLMLMIILGNILKVQVINKLKTFFFNESNLYYLLFDGLHSHVVCEVYIF